jgi:hypothetical protein
MSWLTSMVVVVNQAGVINMKKILTILIAVLLFPVIAEAAKLPPCKWSVTYLHNCTKFVEYADGESYDGEWRNDKPHGFGVYKANVDGLVAQIRGEFKNGLPNGLGLARLGGEKLFYGEMNNEVGVTLGVYYSQISKTSSLDQGDIEVGEFKNNKLHGEGSRLDFSEGILEIGTFKEGKLVVKSNKSLGDYMLNPYASANDKDAKIAYSKSIAYLNGGQVDHATYWLMSAARNNHKLALKKYQAIQKMRVIEQRMFRELSRRSDNRKSYDYSSWFDSGPTDEEVREAEEYLQNLEEENSFDQKMKKVIFIAGVAMAFGDDAATAFNTAFGTVFGTSANNYDGPCPCPYSIASDGSQCGKRSAYSRTGGAAPACY